MEEIKKIVKDKVVWVQFVKLPKQTDQPFTVELAKNNKYFIDQNRLIIYKSAQNG